MTIKSVNDDTPKNLPAKIDDKKFLELSGGVKSLQLAEGFKIKTQEDFDLVDKQVKDSKDLIKKMEAQKKLENTEYNKIVRANSARYKEPIETLTKLYRAGEQLMKDRRAEERAEAAAKAAEHAANTSDDDDDFEMFDVAATAESRSTTSKTQFRTVYKAEVVDFKLLMQAIIDGKAPPTLVTANEKMLAKYAATYMEDANLPGVEFTTDEVVVSK